MRSPFPRRLWWMAAAAIAAGCTAAERQAPDPFTRTGELVALSGGDAGAANACFTCHALDGGGDGAGAPRIAGLDLGYLQRQLEDFADGRRRHPEMEFIARRLDASERFAVAAHYAAMPVPARDRAPAGPAPALFARGDPGRGLPACATCHGDAGQGIGRGYPPLAGQPAGYLVAQLRAWRLGQRRGDPLNVMQAIARRMTEAEIRSVAAYAAALPVAAPRPGYPAASPTARRAGPRNDASAPPPRAAGPGP